MQKLTIFVLPTCPSAACAQRQGKRRLEKLGRTVIEWETD